MQQDPDTELPPLMENRKTTLQQLGVKKKRKKEKKNSLFPALV